MAPAVGPLLVASAMAMAKLMLVSVVGVLGARYPRDRPVLGKAELQTLSRFAELVLWPAMALWSIGSGVEFGSGAEFGMLCGACAFHCLLSLGLGRLGVRVLGVPPALRNGFLCAAAFNNSAVNTPSSARAACAPALSHPHAPPRRRRCPW
jgi:predicted permease